MVESSFTDKLDQYAVDCYKPVAGQIMVVSTVIKNTMGCKLFKPFHLNPPSLTILEVGMTYWINTMAATIGYVTPHMIFIALDTGLALAGVFFFFYFGKTMRRLTKSAAVHSFE